MRERAAQNLLARERAARPRGRVHLDALANERVPGQHHLVFPAVEPAELAVGPLVQAKAAAIAFAPDRALVHGWLELAMFAQDGAFAADEEQRAVDCPARRRITLRDADHDVAARPAGRRAKRVRGWRRHLDPVEHELLQQRPKGGWFAQPANDA
jgi:hypothetical protein